MNGTQKNKQWLIILLSVVALLVVVGLFLGIYLINQAPPKEDDGGKTAGSTAPSDTLPSFHVVVIHADGTEKTFTYTYTDETYVGEVLLAQGLIEGDQGDFGLYVKIVDGERAVYEEDGAYWSFYIGDTYAVTGVDMTPIEEGKTYTLKYEAA